MTVQELIDQLLLIENKDAIIKVCDLDEHVSEAFDIIPDVETLDESVYYIDFDSCLSLKKE